MEAIRFDNLSFSYAGSSENALHSVSLSVNEGEFLVLCGASGSGKTTLLRLLKPALAPQGTRQGDIRYFGEAADALDDRRQSAEIGFVRQSPEDQIVTDKVWHELAFGLENLGCDSELIRRRVAETAAFFGMESWFRKNVSELSGGQKQLLALASVLVMQPRVLLLDEPTARLDPIAASEFYYMLARIHRELGVTILLSEHRLEEAAALCDRVAVLEQGRLLCAGTPREIAAALRETNSPMLHALPAATRLWAGVGEGGPCPLTVPEGQTYLADYAARHPLLPLPPDKPALETEHVIEASGIWCRYERNGRDILRGVDLSLCKGEKLAILGGNGAGKTTLLHTMVNITKHLRGKCSVKGRVAYLPQDPQTLFTESSVAIELGENIDKSIILSCGLGHLMDRHPYDLSGGEQQRLALAKLLRGKPDILLLDEPTKGMDAAYKARLRQILDAFCARGGSVILVSHDMEFCAQIADRCALLFDGTLVSRGTPREFFSGSLCFTTAAGCIAGRTLPGAVTVEELIAACGGRLPEPPEDAAEPEGGSVEEPPGPNGGNPVRKPMPARTKLAALFDLLLIPLTILLGTRYLGRDQYYFVSLLAALEAMLPFFLAFEARRPRARELVTVASLCAICVAGRAAFFMLQQFKPVIALVVVAGVAFGGETGFLVGAVTMLVSNLFFGQGPWTPFQMLAMGLTGFLAGLLRTAGVLRPRRTALCVYGAFAALVIYGGIVNPAAALLSTPELTWQGLLAYYAAGLPMDLVQTAATVLFLALVGETMLEKLERVKIKYGVLQN